MQSFILASQLSLMFGVSPVTITKWIRDPEIGFPEPVVTLPNRRVWDAAAVETWRAKIATSPAFLKIRPNEKREKDFGAQPSDMLNNAQAARELGVTTRTLFRWCESQHISLSQPIKINGRRFFTRRMIEEFKEKLRGGHLA